MIVLYTKNECKFCVQAKSILKEWGVEYTEINIEEQPSGKDFLTLEGHRTVPQLYWHDSILVHDGAQGLLNTDKESFEKLVERKSLDVGREIKL